MPSHAKMRRNLTEHHIVTQRHIAEPVAAASEASETVWAKWNPSCTCSAANALCLCVMRTNTRAKFVQQKKEMLDAEFRWQRHIDFLLRCLSAWMRVCARILINFHLKSFFFTRIPSHSLACSIFNGFASSRASATAYSETIVRSAETGFYLISSQWMAYDSWALSIEHRHPKQDYE